LAFPWGGERLFYLLRPEPAMNGALIVAAFTRKTMLMRSCASASMDSALGARALLRTPLLQPTHFRRNSQV
jgi:hypothetical protein